MIRDWLGVLYLLSLTGIAVFGILGLVTLWYYARHRKNQYPCPELADHEWPLVTVQLPVFNEALVVERLIDAVAKLDYPAGRLEIQVIDDSSDETTGIAVECVRRHREQGVNISLLHRENRDGFKAGALDRALKMASGDFIAIFDADFQPKPDFLRQTIPHLVTDDRLGMVQTRWGHLNPDQSVLTAAQVIALDKHFAMEQTVRHRADLFPKFNGSAGVWRRRCLVEAGGWEADTVCEDLCLSTRAILKEWDFLFLNDVVSPAELPTTISAYKNQQSRWAKGSTQCLVKFGPSILKARSQKRVARLYALLSMAGYASHLALLLLLLAQVPLIYLGYQPPSLLPLLGIAGVGQPVLFFLGQSTLYQDWRRRLPYFPALLLIAIGLAASNSRAILSALFSRKHHFVRTPKGLDPAQTEGRSLETIRAYRLPFDWIVLVELLLALYAGVGLMLCVINGSYGAIFFMLSCFLGFGYVFLLSIRERQPFHRKWRKPSLADSTANLPLR